MCFAMVLLLLDGGQDGLSSTSVLLNGVAITFITLIVRAGAGAAHAKRPAHAHAHAHVASCAWSRVWCGAWARRRVGAG